MGRWKSRVNHYLLEPAATRRLAEDCLVGVGGTGATCSCRPTRWAASPSYTPDSDNSEAISFIVAITIRIAGVIAPSLELASVTKRVRLGGTRKRVQFHGLLDQRHQTVDACPEVDWLAVQEHLQIGFEAKHQCRPNAAIMALTRAASRSEHSSSSFTPLGN